MATSNKKPASNPLLIPAQQDAALSQPPASQRTVVVQQVEYSFSGPLPPTHELQGYERVLPGAAERILSDA